MLGGVQRADAGVIEGSSNEVQIRSSSALTSVASAALADQQSEDDPRCSAGDQSAAMAPTIVSVGHGANVNAMATCLCVSLPTPRLSGRVWLSNAALPASPVLDGLLKPS